MEKTKKPIRLNEHLHREPKQMVITGFIGNYIKNENKRDLQKALAVNNVDFIDLWKENVQLI